jgi:hypothetical protein
VLYTNNCTVFWGESNHSLHHILKRQCHYNDYMLYMLCIVLHNKICTCTSYIWHNEMVRRVNFAICFWSWIWHCVNYKICDKKYYSHDYDVFTNLGKFFNEKLVYNTSIIYIQYKLLIMLILCMYTYLKYSAVRCGHICCPIYGYTGVATRGRSTWWWQCLQIQGKSWKWYSTDKKFKKKCICLYLMSCVLP